MTIPHLDETFAVPVKKAAPSIGVGMTRLYELIKSGEIDSYRDGKARKVVVASLKAYVERQIAAEAIKPRVSENAVSITSPICCQMRPST